MASLLAKDFWSGNTPAAVRIRNSWLAKMDKWTQNTVTSQKKSFKKYMNDTFFSTCPVYTYILYYQGISCVSFCRSLELADSSHSFYNS